MNPDDAEVELILDAAGRGDPFARDRLVELYRDRLKRMISIRIDRRLAARLDESDVVQDTLVEAAGRLDDYLRDRPIPFYPWLYRLANDRLIQLQRFHVEAQIRSVDREAPRGMPLSENSTAHLAELLAREGTSPSRSLIEQEQQRLTIEALGSLPERDREILVMYYLEDLKFAEIGQILGISEAAAKVRHSRALKRLRGLIVDPGRSS